MSTIGKSPTSYLQLCKQLFFPEIVSASSLLAIIVQIMYSALSLFVENGEPINSLTLIQLNKGQG